MVEAFYFELRNQQLFASYRLPVGGNRRVLTVICPPLFLEYMRGSLRFESWLFPFLREVST
ncbi:MAG: hypothetical protein ACREC3_08190 [Methyloceanibacter sp.]